MTMPVQPDYYFRFKCAKCGMEQRVYDGDPSDQTLPDVDAVECWACGSIEVICDDVTLAVLGGAENLFTRKGEP